MKKPTTDIKTKNPIIWYFLVGILLIGAAAFVYVKFIAAGEESEDEGSGGEGSSGSKKKPPIRYIFKGDGERITDDAELKAFVEKMKNVRGNVS